MNTIRTQCAVYCIPTSLYYAGVQLCVSEWIVFSSPRLNVQKKQKSIKFDW